MNSQLSIPEHSIMVLHQLTSLSAKHIKLRIVSVYCFVMGKKH